MTKQLAQQAQTGTATFSPVPSGLLQRKCAACGTHTPGGGSCTTCADDKEGKLQRQPAGQKLPPPVLDPEYPLKPLVEDDANKTDEEKYKKAGGKVVEAILETGPGKAATDWLTGKLFGSGPAAAATLTGIGGTVAGLALTSKELPFQMPFVPLPPRFVRIEGLSVKFIYNGPVNNPTEGVLVFQYKPPVKPAPKRRTEEQGEATPAAAGGRTDDQALSDAAIRYAVVQQENARLAAARAAASEPAQTPQPAAPTLKRPALLDGKLPAGLGYDPLTPLLLGGELKLELPPFILPKATKLPLQKKLNIGASNDPLEAEADRVADQVLARSPSPDVAHAPLRIQRFSPQASPDADTAPESVHQTLRGSGAPLESGLRQDMETRFGHDFSCVRVHSNGEAAQSARDVEANAYTVGNNIVFGAGQFSPGSGAGQRLLAHELTHVVQQGSGGNKILHRDSFAGAAGTMAKDKDRPLKNTKGSLPATKNQGGTVVPKTASNLQNCAGDTTSINKYINWPFLGKEIYGPWIYQAPSPQGDWSSANEFVPSGCTRVNCTGVDTNNTRCKCSELDSVVFLYQWPEKFQAKDGTEIPVFQSDFHMMGRSANLLPSGWHSKMDSREKVVDIRDPMKSLHSAYPHTKTKDRTIMQHCFCCDQSKIKVA